jgi:o-succinylbenzoate---CoA ligase
MGKIKITNASYTFEQIRIGDYMAHDPYFSAALDFCREWLSGKQEFSQQTSGSTGLPKEIIVQRKQMEVSAAGTKAFFGLKTGLRLLGCLNTEMIAGKMMLVRAMEWDAELTLTKPVANPFVNLAEDVAFDFAAMVPMQVAAAINQSKKQLQHTGILIIGGAPTPTDLAARIVSCHLNAWQTYGMTETVSHVALAKISGTDPVYQTLPGVKIGTDVEGRLWIEAAMAINGKVQSNDVVELVGNTAFKWIGRSDFTINSGGIKLHPEQLETSIEPILFDILGFHPFFVAGKADEVLGEKLIMLIEGEETFPGEEIRNQLKNQLPIFHVPKEVLFLREFVRTASGKINRTATLKLLP